MNQCLYFFNALLNWFSCYCWAWIYSKRRSGFFRQTCQCFSLYTWHQICMGLKACLHHGYAIVMYSCDLIKIQKNTSFLMEVHRGFSMYPQKMLSRALLCAVLCYVASLSTAACAGSLESHGAWLGSLPVPVAKPPGNLGARSQCANVEVSAGFCYVSKSWSCSTCEMLHSVKQFIDLLKKYWEIWKSFQKITQLKVIMFFKLCSWSIKCSGAI